MKKYESLIIGHVTMDINTDCLGNEIRQEGGAVIYSSASAAALGHKVAALTKIASEDADRLKSFTLSPEDVYCAYGDASTDMVNRYLTADKERRISLCTRKGTPFSSNDIPNVDCEIYHFAGLTYGDFPEELLVELSKKGKIAVDVQGFLRNVADDGSMYFKDWQDKEKYLPYIDFLKTDAYEAEVLTGLTDRKEAAKVLFSLGAKEILITHNSEVLVYDGKEFFTCPIRARNLSGRTGRGDTTFAAYLNERLHGSAKDALLVATATVSLKMESVGVFKGTRADVDNYIQQFYKDYE